MDAYHHHHSYSTSAKSSSPPQKTLSCAECRRSKLRCDRQFPCETCRKRGLEHLCPNDALVTRPKSMAADAEYLRQENIRLQQRVQELEAVLSGLLQPPQPQPQLHVQQMPHVDQLSAYRHPSYHGHYGGRS
ncbi:hypothetical protein M422DRAFT_36818 [Sphaerobolus stellatus SS14]|uniref:Zn(2)-C6 fungal-type domain-containing protein n=1 Tax=Sphaerobolus stellatus (strain SS14) TaxID=990650 RepID=A0A0C9TJJ3_SPHS4|nr:hypothetical protein M422DRAFT_36818 [Sphaerobolus stellatus SS14]